jgi:hypothetical protein
MDNLELYKKLSDVPQWARRTIKEGTLKGMTDISPMWRIEAMTEAFGPCGIGWYYEITRQWEVEKDDLMVFCNINLYIKVGGEWSKPIQGTGGNKIVARFGTSGGRAEGYLKTSDEGYKMALTDALSVAMKSLGVGSSIYAGMNDTSKYIQYLEEINAPQEPEQPKEIEVKPQPPEPAKILTKEIRFEVWDKLISDRHGWTLYLQSKDILSASEGLDNLKTTEPEKKTKIEAFMLDIYNNWHLHANGMKANKRAMT